MNHEATPNVEAEAEATYEAPQIESVITPEEIEREVAYAGAIQTSNSVLA